MSDSINYVTDGVNLFNCLLQRLTEAMVISSVTLLFFTMAILGSCSMADILKIWRETIFPNDDVTVPNSQCFRTQAQCDRYNAKHLSQCLCYCDKIGGKDSAFWEPSYTCIPARSARNQSGTTFS